MSDAFTRYRDPQFADRGVMPVERIVFGPDYPHAEGFAEPKQFFTKVADLPIDDQRKIMRDNARELTFA